MALLFVLDLIMFSHNIVFDIRPYAYEIFIIDITCLRSDGQRFQTTGRTRRFDRKVENQN